MQRLPRLLAVSLLSLALLPVAARAADPAPDLPSAPDDAFYTTGVPDGAAPGALIRVEELFAPGDFRLWAILYRSTGPDGAPTAVSGLVLAPSEPAAGPRPVIAVNHGTTGLGDACSPSRVTAQRLELAVAGQALARQGWVVVATDYAGLGTPGMHAYLDGPSAGHAVLDAIRAAQALPDAAAGDAVVLAGISQGGHATLWAARMAAEAAPELNVLGAIAAAPAGDLAEVARWVFSPDAGRPSWRNDLLIARAWSEIYDFPIEEVLTPEALPLAARLDEECGVYPDAFPLRPGVAELPALADALERNTPLGIPIAAPILYLQGDADEQIPVVAARTTVERLCADGSVVDYRELPGVDHVGALYDAARIDAAIAWAAARFAGEPAADTCPGR